MNSKTDKLAPSLIAMLFGWGACNLITWICALIYELMLSERQGLTSTVFIILCIFSMYSCIVTIIAWLFVFLPIDLFIPNSSKLRVPKASAILGFSSGATLVLVFWLLVKSPNSGNDADIYILALCLLAGITGSVAGYARSRIWLNPKPHTS